MSCDLLQFCFFCVQHLLQTRQYELQKNSNKERNNTKNGKIKQEYVWHKVIVNFGEDYNP